MTASRRGGGTWIDALGQPVRKTTGEEGEREREREKRLRALRATLSHTMGFMGGGDQEHGEIESPCGSTPSANPSDNPRVPTPHPRLHDELEDFVQCIYIFIYADMYMYVYICIYI